LLHSNRKFVTPPGDAKRLFLQQRYELLLLKAFQLIMRGLVVTNVDARLLINPIKPAQIVVYFALVPLCWGRAVHLQRNLI